MSTKVESISPVPALKQADPRYTPKPKGSWKKLVGRAKDDELSRDAFRLGEEWRVRMNREGH
jgi:hypothetical protein